jgi:hypothetical protein
MSPPSNPQSLNHYSPEQKIKRLEGIIRDKQSQIGRLTQEQKMNLEQLTNHIHLMNEAQMLKLTRRQRDIKLIVDGNSNEIQHMLIDQCNKLRRKKTIRAIGQNTQNAHPNNNAMGTGNTPKNTSRTRPKHPKRTTKHGH